MPSLRGVAFVAAALLITAYGGLLRFEALNVHYGWMGQPAPIRSTTCAMRGSAVPPETPVAFRLWYVRLEPAGTMLTAVQ